MSLVSQEGGGVIVVVVDVGRFTLIRLSVRFVGVDEGLRALLTVVSVTLGETGVELPNGVPLIVFVTDGLVTLVPAEQFGSQRKHGAETTPNPPKKYTPNSTRLAIFFFIILDGGNNKHLHTIHFCEKIQNNCEKKKKDIIKMCHSLEGGNLPSIPQGK
ncbi:TPA: hypothetical protein DCZ36_01415 [Candidatus Gracilibacteria bacterium]|nr:hypothetical protein [Candidatus Gracilibacteria bacterium]